MNEAVKAVPGRRERKALETRRRVLDASEELFVRDGYTATTMTAIAEAADVAVQTLYAGFGTKRAILTELLAARTVGDDGDAPLRDRDEWQAMEQEADPRAQLAAMVRIATRIGARMAALYEVTAAAADADPEIAELFRRQQDSRYEDQRRVAESLFRRGALRDGLSVAEATDIMWTVANPRTYRSLVGERQWSTGDYERWLTDLLATSLLAQPFP